MKKIISFTLVLLVLLSVNLKGEEVSADHLTYQKMDIYGGQLLKDYSEEEIQEGCDEINDRKFYGWETNDFTKGAKCYFTAYTIFSYYNAGTTAIEYKYTSTVTRTTKVSFDATGSVGYDLSGTKSGFKHGLKTSLKLEYSYDDTVIDKEYIEIEFKCDPKTRVIMYVVGEGVIYNGAAKRYICWFEAGEGGYEYFVTQTMYQVLEKVEI